MPTRRRLIPYLQAPVGNIAKLAHRMQERMSDGPSSTNWISIGDLDELKHIQSQMLEELIELDALLEKVEKIVNRKDS